MRLQGKLIPQYQQMHLKPNRFLGKTLKKHVDAISRIVQKIPTKSILDYGCGKGMQYTEGKLHEAWGGIMPRLFDPGVPGIDELPTIAFDGVICTSVLEHIPFSELHVALNNLVYYAEKWCFVGIGCSLSRKILPNGLNAHVTLQPEEWWRERVTSAFDGRAVRLEIEFVWAK